MKVHPKMSQMSCDGDFGSTAGWVIGGALNFLDTSWRPKGLWVGYGMEAQSPGIMGKSPV